MTRETALDRKHRWHRFWGWVKLSLFVLALVVANGLGIVASKALLRWWGMA